MGKNKIRLLGLGLVLCVAMACSAWAAGEEHPSKAAPVRLNEHPMSLEGKTIVLRWNGKMSGDTFLTRLGELLTAQVRGVKVIRMWELDRTTADVSKNAEESVAVAGKIAALRPDLVIASQAD